MSAKYSNPEVSASPHVRAKLSTSHIMQLVVLALIPSGCYGVYHFGINALFHILITVAACVASEFLFTHFMHKPLTVTDGSAVVTGLLLAYCLPVAAPLWMGAVGGVFAIIVVKQLFGGLGHNFMNPALAARCFLLLSFPKLMTDYTYGLYDSISSATPLQLLKESGDLGDISVRDMVFGNIGGTIGETCTIAILLGALILLMFNIIDIKIPAIILATFSVCIMLFNYLLGTHDFNIYYLSAQLSGGGLMLGAWFMATDYVTRPVNTKGQVIYAVLIGMLIAVFRWFGNNAEGASFAIIFANLLTPLLERLPVRKAFGTGGKQA